MTDTKSFCSNQNNGLIRVLSQPRQTRSQDHGSEENPMPRKFEGLDTTPWVLKHSKTTPLFLKVFGVLDMNMIEYVYRLPCVSSVQYVQCHFESPNARSWCCTAALYRSWCAVAATNQLRWRRQVWPERQSSRSHIKMGLKMNLDDHWIMSLNCWNYIQSQTNLSKVHLTTGTVTATMARTVTANRGQRVTAFANSDTARPAGRSIGVKRSWSKTTRWPQCDMWVCLFCLRRS
jgi:hypothetical protein